MKRTIALAAIGLLLLVLACAGKQINTDAVLSLGADLAFYEVLKNNPDHKAGVVTALTEIRALLAGEITYAALAQEVAARLPGDYAVEMMLVSDYLLQDSAVIESIPLLDAYKGQLVKRVDRLLLLARL
jgi:hypothetical protein